MNKIPISLVQSQFCIWGLLTAGAWNSYLVGLVSGSWDLFQVQEVTQAAIGRRTATSFFSVERYF